MIENVIIGLKWIIVILIIAVIVSSEFFTNLLTSVGSLVWLANSNFLNFVPREILTIILLLVFAIIIAIWFAFYS